MIYKRFDIDEFGFCYDKLLVVKSNNEEIAFTQVITDGIIFLGNEKNISRENAIEIINNYGKDNGNSFKYYIKLGDTFIIKDLIIKDSSYYMISGYNLTKDNNFSLNTRKIMFSKKKNILDEIIFIRSMPSDTYVGKNIEKTKQLVRIRTDRK